MKSYKAIKGSQYWLQQLIEHKRNVLTDKILIQSGLPIHTSTTWVSPLSAEGYAEYQDGTFLDKLGLKKHREELKNFWPKRGPQWDALGKSDDPEIYFLVEAKANIPELLSDCGAKAKTSVDIIEQGLKNTQKWVGAKSHIAWTTGFYQYANRLAHLYFFRQILKKETYLIYLYFENDYTHIPTCHDAWTGAIELEKRLLGLQNHRQKKHVLEIFIDVKDIKKR